MRITHIPLVPAPAPEERAPASDCSRGELFALMVLGDAMRPEFDPGDIVVVEPDGLAGDGSFVVACCDGEWMLRLLTRRGERWSLDVLNTAAPDAAPSVALDDLTPVRGVVIQKSRPGRRRARKRYVE
ncbi:MAG TPA: S24 family peptidase [Burkholderiaceae bacterium]|nr:S24 family peptidase [Burkholderiaceae bacterium]